MADAFGPIAPAPAADTFVFDFTIQIGVSGVITASAWLCSVDPASLVDDVNSTLRILGPPSFSNTKTTALLGNMIDGCQYLLQATVTLSDGRVLTDSAGLKCTSAPPASNVLTPSDFRHDFPAFADPNVYTEDALAFWIDVVLYQTPLNPRAWRRSLVLGQELFVAHMLTLERQNERQAAAGQAPLALGPATSRSVGGVSVGYDSGSGAYTTDAGFWNLSTYGQRYYYFMMIAGTRPVQI